MAKFKATKYPQGIFSPVFLCRQIQKGTFEFTLSKLIDEVLDVSVFYDRYKNQETGASAYDPRILLKIIFLAYSRGVTSSRRIEEYCQYNTLFMAMSANSRPHHTTIAKFVSTMENEIKDLFIQVLMVCDKRGLIGKEMFAIDGCKLPSNASKEWSGTLAELQRKKEKLEAAIEQILENHKQQDGSKDKKFNDDDDDNYLKSLRRDVAKLSVFLETNEEKVGLSGKPIKSNVTDNESAKMQTSKGVIQGYVGVATVDKKHQVIVNAEAFGQGYEQNLLEPSIEATRANFNAINHEGDVFSSAKVAADNGYHSEDNLSFLYSENIDAYIPDNKFRSRDPRFADREHHKEAKPGQSKSEKIKKFKPDDFLFAEDLSHCICPAGQRLFRSGNNAKVKHYRAYKFKGAKSSCVPCTMRERCLRKPEKTEIRQVAYLIGKSRDGAASYTEKMKAKIDTEVGRAIYGLRLAVGEPPFANIRFNMRLDRFSLRGKLKVNTQWNLFCIVHNMKKLHTYGGCFS